MHIPPPQPDRYRTIATDVIIPTATEGLVLTPYPPT